MFYPKKHLGGIVERKGWKNTQYIRLPMSEPMGLRETDGAKGGACPEGARNTLPPEKNSG